jgi:Icc-related predicted phosphoesterase
MRIVAVADTHLFTNDLTVPDGDVFVHAGDMCRGGSLDELREAAAWIAALPHRHKVIVAGNHDRAFEDAPADARAVISAFIYLQDSAATIDGIRFYGAPWQPEFNGWAFNLPRGAPLADKWQHIPRGIDVLVTHSPPLGIGDATSHEEHYAERAGCDDLLRRVREVTPRLHLFGHIHQDGGLWRDGATTFANVTTWECERGATVIDLDAHAITPIVVPPPR